jgi:hypothetical protein
MTYYDWTILLYINSLNLKYKKKRIHKYKKVVVILYAYPRIGPKKSPFLQNKKYTKDGCEGKIPSHRRKTVFCAFVYLCIGAKKSQPRERSHLARVRGLG